MSEAWAINAQSMSSKTPAATSERLPTPISSAGEPTTRMQAAASGITDASAEAARRLAGPERLCPQA
jgi:hypothetical protein